MRQDTVIVQLRHLYAQMIAGRVKDSAEVARGILGSVIETLESTPRDYYIACPECGSITEHDFKCSRVDENPP
jgi:hypothetical protein